MTDLGDVSTFVTYFKGAALSCLILMWVMRDIRRNWSRDDLAMLTGYNPKTVAIGLQRLVLKKLVARLNYEVWQLTDRGYQFSFDELLRVRNLDSESPNYGLSGSSSSILINHDMHDMHELKQQPLLPLRVQNTDSDVVRDSTVHPDRDRLIKLLTHRCGCTPQKAAKAVETALAAGIDPLHLEIRALWWLGYCLSSEGQGIKAKGIYIAERVEQDIPCPDYFDLRDIPDRYENLKTEIEELSRKYEVGRSGHHSREDVS
jgi:hypothetical protein